MFLYMTDSPDMRILPEDWDQFHFLLQQMLYRVPTLKQALLEKLCNGPESFSPDCKWILGESAEVKMHFHFFFSQFFSIYL